MNSNTSKTIEELLRLTNCNGLTNPVTRPEYDILSKYFYALVRSQGKIDRAQFRDLLSDHFGLDDSLLMDRIFKTFDLDMDNAISHEEFIKGMSVFLRGRFDERMKFYDLNGDRSISKEEMFQLLKNSLVRGAEEDEDGAKELVDIVLRKLDEDRDGRVSENDFASAVDKEQLLLEAFGQCLPTLQDVNRYLNGGKMATFV